MGSVRQGLLPPLDSLPDQTSCPQESAPPAARGMPAAGAADTRRAWIRRGAWLLAVMAGGQAAHGNDLMDLYRLAQARDAVLAAATGQRDAAIEVRPQALAQLLPQLTASASAGRAREGAQLTSPGAGIQETNCMISAGQDAESCYSNTRSYGLTLSQTLWSYESFSRLREASAQAASGEATLLAAQQQLLLRVAVAYFGVLSARDQLDTARGAREAFSNLLEQAKIRERLGIGARSGVDQAQSFYDTTEQTVIDAQSALDDAVLALAQIIGSPPPTLAPLQESIPLTAPDPASVEAWVASARMDNPSVRAALLAAEAADRDIGVQRGKGLPVLTLSGTTSRDWEDAAFGGNTRLDSAGVQVTWPLFQGGAVASALRQARATYRQAQAQYDSMQRDTERQTRAAYRNVVTGITRIGAARRAVESSRVAVEASQRNLEFGTGSVFDLLQSQQILYSAQRAYSQTRYDYLTALLTLKQQAGNLSERDLAVIDGLLVSHAP